MRRPSSLVLLTLAMLGSPLFAQQRAKDLLRHVGIEQRLNEPVPLDLVFRDETGRDVRLGDYFGKRPVILVLAYYKCPMLCNQVLNGLLGSLQKLAFDAGSQFEVVTVSFDPRETAPLAAAKKATYVEQYGRPGAGAGWHFLTGEEAAIRRLAIAVGFRYVYDPKLDQFAHASGIMVLTPSGKLARYFYGIDYKPRDLRLGLVEASANQIGSPADRLLLLCYHYDPTTGEYSAAVMGSLRVAGLLTLLALAVFFYILWRRAGRDHLATAS